jgi:hypothetical protein
MLSENKKEFPFSFPFSAHRRLRPKSPKSADAPRLFHRSAAALQAAAQLGPNRSSSAPNPPAQPSARTGPSEPGLQPEAEAAMAPPPSLLACAPGTSWGPRPYKRRRLVRATLAPPCRRPPADAAAASLLCAPLGAEPPQARHRP